MLALIALLSLSADPVVSVVRIEQPDVLRLPRLHVVAHRGVKDVVRECPAGDRALKYLRGLDFCRPAQAHFHVVELTDKQLLLYASTLKEDLGRVTCQLRPDEAGLRAEALACAKSP